MEKTINKVLFKHQESILFNIGLIVLVPFVCTIAILIKNGTDASYVKAFFGLLVFGYIYISFSMKEIILYCNKIVIIYPLSPFVKNKFFWLNDINSFKLLKGTTYDPSQLIIYLKNGKKKVYYFHASEEDQELINCLRQMKFEVKVKGNIWK